MLSKEEIRFRIMKAVECVTCNHEVHVAINRAVEVIANPEARVLDKLNVFMDLNSITHRTKCVRSAFYSGQARTRRIPLNDGSQGPAEVCDAV